MMQGVGVTGTVPRAGLQMEVLAEMIADYRERQSPITGRSPRRGNVPPLVSIVTKGPL